MRPCDRAEMLVALGYCMSDSIVTQDTGNALNTERGFLLFVENVVVDEKRSFTRGAVHLGSVCVSRNKIYMPTGAAAPRSPPPRSPPPRSRMQRTSYLNRGRRHSNESALPAVGGREAASESVSSFREELSTRSALTRSHVRSSADRAFAQSHNGYSYGDTLIYQLSERTAPAAPPRLRFTSEVEPMPLASASVAAAPVGSASAGVSRPRARPMSLERSRAADMVDSAIDRARRAVSDAQAGSRAADSLASRVQAALEGAGHLDLVVAQRGLAALEREDERLERLERLEREEREGHETGLRRLEGRRRPAEGSTDLVRNRNGRPSATRARSSRAALSARRMWETLDDDGSSSGSEGESSDGADGTADAFARRFRARSNRSVRPAAAHLDAPDRLEERSILSGGSTLEDGSSAAGDTRARNGARTGDFARPSAMLTRAGRTLDLMRERANMLQLVLELSRQELELNLQRMRMEEELHLAVALSRSLDDDDDESNSKPKGVSVEVLDASAPRTPYASAVALDKRANGAASRLPGGAECVICQANLLPQESVRVLRCRHTFHADCIDSWLCRSVCCPLCRSCVEAEAQEKD